MDSRWERISLVLAAVLAVGLALPTAAAAARIVTWGPFESRFVDPSEAPPSSYNEPPGVPDRPNALRVNVYLPTGYGRDRDRSWPVLYLLHGQGDGFDTWAHPERGDLLDTVRGFNGIVVMPDGDRGFYTNWWHGGRRGAPAWERYHLEELIPLVERRLRLREGRRWHAIAGLSMGGEGAMFYASQRPRYFGSAASFSGPLSIQRLTYQQGFDAGTGQSSEAIYGDPAAQEFYWRGHNPKELVGNLRHARVFVAAGDGIPGSLDEADNVFGMLVEAEVGMQASEFVAAARGAGVDVTYRPHQGIHDWPYWRADLRNAIQWDLFRRPPRPHGRWSYETVARVGEMWGLRFHFARAPDALITFRRAGRRLSGEGSGRVTIRTRAACRLTERLPFAVRLPRPTGPRCG